jgi:hypothetical protein
MTAEENHYDFLLLEVGRGQRAPEASSRKVIASSATAALLRKKTIAPGACQTADR